MNKLLAIRVSNADEGIDRTEAALGKAIGRAEALDKLPMDLMNIRVVAPWMGYIEGLVNYCKKLIAELPGSFPPALGPLVANAENALGELNKGLKDIDRRLPRIQRSSQQSEQLDDYRARTIALLEAKKEKLAAIRSAAQNAVPQAAGAQDGAPQPRKALLELENEKFLWGEHIETIAGMILRDERFDNGLCALADQLIGICRGYGPFGATHTFNVLGRDHAALREMRNALYFKFPAWSVWGLPLVAHDFWHASSERVYENELLKKRLESLPGAADLWNNPMTQYCLADTFATYVIGPAYAFACILLVLNIDSVQDRLRADSIFATLSYLAGDNPPVYDFAAELKKCWKEAADLELPVPSEVASVPAVLEAFLKFMPQALRYEARAWLSYGEDLIDLLEEDPDSGDWNVRLAKYTVPSGLDLRHVLHAVWLCRWNGVAAADSGAPELAEQAQRASDRVLKLASRAEKLCRKVSDARERKPILAEDFNGSGAASGSAIIQRFGGQ